MRLMGKPAGYRGGVLAGVEMRLLGLLEDLFLRFGDGAEELTEPCG